MKITIEFNDTDMMNYKKGIQNVLDIVSKISNAEKTKQQEIEKMLKSSGGIKQEQNQPEVKQEQQTPQYDVVDMQKAAFEKAKQIENGVKKVKALIKKYGVETLPEMDKKHYEAFLKELEELV